MVNSCMRKALDLPNMEEERASSCFVHTLHEFVLLFARQLAKGCGRFLMSIYADVYVAPWVFSRITRIHCYVGRVEACNEAA